MRRQPTPQTDSFSPTTPLALVLICCSMTVCVAGCHRDNQAQQDQRQNEQPKVADRVESKAIGANQPDTSDNNVAGGSAEPNQATKQNELDSAKIPDIDGFDPPPVVHHGGKRYTSGQLHKNNTLMILVYEGDIRAEMMLKKYLPFVERGQAKQAKKLIWSYDDDFVRLRRQRAEILEHASNDQNIALQVFENRLAVADLVSEIRSKITNEVMTPEQSRVARETLRKEKNLR